MSTADSSGPPPDRAQAQSSRYWWSHFFWVLPAALCLLFAPPGEPALKVGWLIGVSAIGLVAAAIYVVYCLIKRRRPGLVVSLSLIFVTGLIVAGGDRLMQSWLTSYLQSEATRPPAPPGSFDPALYPVKAVESSDWNWVAELKDAHVWVDFIGMKRKGDEVHVLIKRAFKAPAATLQGPMAGAMSMLAIECTAKKFHTSWERAYDARGDFKTLFVGRGAVDTKPVPVGSGVEVVMWRVCGNRPAN